MPAAELWLPSTSRALPGRGASGNTSCTTASRTACQQSSHRPTSHNSRLADNSLPCQSASICACLNVHMIMHSCLCTQPLECLASFVRTKHMHDLGNRTAVFEPKVEMLEPILNQICSRSQLAAAMPSSILLLQYAQDMMQHTKGGLIRPLQ